MAMPMADRETGDNYHPAKEIMASISDIDEELAKITCETTVTKLNIKRLCETIVHVSKEVEGALLRDKWASRLMMEDGETSVQRSPVEDAMAICRELIKSPECFEGVMKSLKEKEASLDEGIDLMQTSLKELDAT